MAQVKNFDSLYTELSQRAAERPDGSATVEALDKGVHAIGKKIMEEAKYESQSTTIITAEDIAKKQAKSGSRLNTKQMPNSPKKYPSLCTGPK